MKTTFLKPLAAVSAVILLAIACKKQNPTTPVNKTIEDTPCSFCFGDMLEMGTDHLIISTPYAQQVSFLIDGQLVGPNPIVAETPTGFYGYQGGVSIAFNSAQLPMSCTSNKVTFVHARFASNTNTFPSLVNVRFPGTPLIATTPDSLNYFLNPYGYTVERYFQPGQVCMSQNPNENFAGVVDSIIIRGPEFETVTIGANLFESELRSICVAHE